MMRGAPCRIPRNTRECATTMTRSDGGANTANKIDHAELARLRQRLRGSVVTPGDEAYEDSRRVWNGMVDKRPSLVSYCATPDDVGEIIALARSRELPLAVRSGGHNVAGSSVCDGGVVADLSPMKAITVDPERRVARAEAGLTLGEFDRATQAYGLATTMGVVSGTGIAGLTLGGGFGKLGRKHGLACDNLVAADVVTANGHLVRASADENGDLFWALRGGGGNFGIVTAFEYRLYPLGPEVLAGSLLYDFDQAREVLPAAYELAYNAPDAVSVDIALAMAEPGKPVLSVSPLFAGDIEEGQRVLKPFRRLGSPLEDSIAPVSYLEVQCAGDSAFPPGRRYYWKAQYLDEPGDTAFETLLEQFAAAPAVGCLAVLQQVGGAIANVPEGDTPYVNRGAAYDCFPVAIWDDPADDEANIRWARDFWAAVQPYSTGGVYANNLGDEGEDRVHAAFGDNYRRLAEIKRKYDPTNLFRLNQNIRPVGSDT